MGFEFSGHVPIPHATWKPRSGRRESDFAQHAMASARNIFISLDRCFLPRPESIGGVSGLEFRHEFKVGSNVR
jgi:hypothetical protein